MLKVLVPFILILISKPSFGLTYSPYWTQDYQKKLIVECSEDEFQCEDICGENKCEIQEKVCRNCIGSSLYITHIFREMGRGFRNIGNEVSYYEVLEVFQSKHFATFTSKSIYNQLERFNSLGLRKKFQSLCPNSTEYPVVVFKTKEISRKLDKVAFVVCGDKAFEMVDEALIDVNDKVSFDSKYLY